MSTDNPPVIVDRSRQAIDFITSRCRRVGAFFGSTEAHFYLKDTAEEMASARPSPVFPDRYLEHVAYAVDLAATHPFLTPPAALASVYLATRFEYYFRILSGKLNGDGTWTSPDGQEAAFAAINDRRIRRDRISSVALAYRIMMLDETQPIVKHCQELDNTLYATPATVTGPRTVRNIGDRIEFGRHATGHGHWGDMSSEAVFYGLMTALVFYDQR